MLRQHLLTSIRSLFWLTLLTGFLYPLSMTLVAQLFFSRQANGSLIFKHAKPIGSSLIGQPFDQPHYFWSRPSATSPSYNGAASSGSNMGPLNPALTKAIQERIDALRKVDPDNPLPIPVDLVTASGSGLDPHISPAAAQYQMKRVARERHLSDHFVAEAIKRHTNERLLGLIGESRVNVLELNLELDTRTP